MDDAEGQLRELISTADVGSRVGSVASICELTGLSTGSAIAVMRRLIDDGLVRSTRGPDGGYWRTEVPVAGPVVDVCSELTALAANLRRTANRLEAVATLL